MPRLRMWLTSLYRRFGLNVDMKCLRVACIVNCSGYTRETDISVGRSSAACGCEMFIRVVWECPLGTDKSVGRPSVKPVHEMYTIEYWIVGLIPRIDHHP